MKIVIRVGVTFTTIHMIYEITPLAHLRTVTWTNVQAAVDIVPLSDLPFKRQSFPDDFKPNEMAVLDTVCMIKMQRKVTLL